MKFFFIYFTLLMMVPTNSSALEKIRKYSFKVLEYDDFFVKLHDLADHGNLVLKVLTDKELEVYLIAKSPTPIKLLINSTSSDFSVSIEKYHEYSYHDNLDSVLIEISNFWDLETVRSDNVHLEKHKKYFKSIKQTLFTLLGQIIVKGSLTFNSFQAEADGVLLQITISPLVDLDQYVGVSINYIKGKNENFNSLFEAICSNLYLIGSESDNDRTNTFFDP